MKLGWIGLGLGAVIVSAAAYTAVRVTTEADRLPTGRYITPSGDQTEVGSSPINMKLSPDGKYVAVTDCGFRQQLSILDSSTGKLVSKIEFKGGRRPANGLYFGLAFHRANQQTVLYASRGAQDMISTYELGDDGSLKHLEDIKTPPPTDGGGMPHHIAGLVFDNSGGTLYAVNNQTHAFNGMRGSVTVVLGSPYLKNLPVGGYPMDIAFAPANGNPAYS